MYYTITNGQAVEATIANASNPHLFIAAQSQAWRHERGIYSQLIEGDVAAPTAAPDQDAIIVPHPVPQESISDSAPFHISKSKLREAMYDLGRAAEFRAFLAADLKRQEYYDDSQYLESNHPMVLAALDQITGILPEGVTAQELLLGCRV